MSQPPDRPAPECPKSCWFDGKHVPYTVAGGDTRCAYCGVLLPVAPARPETSAPPAPEWNEGLAHRLKQLTRVELLSAREKQVVLAALQHIEGLTRQLAERDQRLRYVALDHRVQCPSCRHMVACGFKFDQNPTQGGGL